MRHAAWKGVSKPDEMQRHDAVAADFVRIELELADTFCRLALESHAPERAQQHRFCAHGAMDAALSALSNAEMKEKELEGIVTKIEEVKAFLATLEGGSPTHPSC